MNNKTRDLKKVFLSKKEQLQKNILKNSEHGIVVVKKEDLDLLEIKLEDHKSTITKIKHIPFMVYKLDDSLKSEYGLQRQSEINSKVENVNFIDESQAKKIGLTKDVDRVKMGNQVFNIHYVDSEDLPQNYQEYLEEKTTAPAVETKNVLLNKPNQDTAREELEEFFAELRKFEKDLSEESKAELEKLEVKGFEALDSGELLEVLTEEPNFLKVKDIHELAKDSKLSKVDKVRENDKVNLNQLGQNLKPLSQNEIDFVYYSSAPEEIRFNYKKRYKNVHNFLVQLVKFYDVAPVELESRLQKFVFDNQKPVFDKEQKELDVLIGSKFDNNELEQKISEIQSQLNELKAVQEQRLNYLNENSLDLETDEEIQKYNEEINSLEEQLRHLDYVLKLKSDKRQELEEKYPDFKIRNYVDVESRKEIVEENQNYILSNIDSFDNQLNKIEYKKQLLEELLAAKLQKIHEANKAKVEADLKAQQEKEEQNNLALIKAQEEQDRLERLAEIGSIQDNAAKIQSQIELEEVRIDNALQDLKEVKIIDDFESKLEEVKRLKVEIEERKNKLNEELVNAKLQLLKKEREVNDVLQSGKQKVYNLEKEVLTVVRDFRNQIRKNNESTWESWQEKGIDLINSIFSRKTEVLSRISTIVSSQIERLSLEQIKSLRLALNRQKNWDQVFEAIASEYKELGYFVAEPQYDEVDLLEELSEREPLKVELSPKVEQIINFPLSLELSDDKDLLIGLDPKVQDDFEFLIIDQVGNLTPEQEVELERIKAQKAEEEKAMQSLAIIEAQELEKSKEVVQAQAVKAIHNQEKIDTLLAQEQSNIEEKLKEDEIKSLEILQYRNQVNSEITGDFKKEIYDLAKTLLKTKRVDLDNEKLVIENLSDDEREQLRLKKLQQELQDPVLKDQENALEDQDKNLVETKEKGLADDQETKEEQKSNETFTKDEFVPKAPSDLFFNYDSELKWDNQSNNDEFSYVDVDQLPLNPGEPVLSEQEKQAKWQEQLNHDQTHLEENQEPVAKEVVDIKVENLNNEPVAEQVSDIKVENANNQTYVDVESELELLNTYKTPETPSNFNDNEELEITDFNSETLNLDNYEQPENKEPEFNTFDLNDLLSSLSSEKYLNADAKSDYEDEIIEESELEKAEKNENSEFFGKIYERSKK